MSSFQPGGSNNFKIFIGVLSPLLLLLLGCQLSERLPLPTLVPTAFFINPSPTYITEPVPATYTVNAQPFLADSGFSTRAATWSPLPSPSPFPSPTAVVRIGRYPQTINVPYLDVPPDIVECNGQGAIFRSRFRSNVAGPWRSYHAYLPPCYGQDGHVYPVIYLIHGSIQTDSHWLELGLLEYASEGINSGRYPPFIVIMPFSGRLGNISSGGSNSIEGVTVNNLLPFIDETFCTWNDPAGRSIGGISRGGYWALEIAFNNPELFGASAGHSSHLRLETDPPKYNPLVISAEADLSNMRIWLDRGEKDFLRSGQDQLHEELTRLGIDHEYYVNSGGHSDLYWASHVAEYLDWHTVHWPKDRLVLPPCN